MSYSTVHTKLYFVLPKDLGANSLMVIVIPLVEISANYIEEEMCYLVTSNGLLIVM